MSFGLLRSRKWQRHDLINHRFQIPVKVSQREEDYHFELSITSIRQEPQPKSAARDASLSREIFGWTRHREPKRQKVARNKSSPIISLSTRTRQAYYSNPNYALKLHRYFSVLFYILCLHPSIPNSRCTLRKVFNDFLFIRHQSPHSYLIKRIKR